MSHYTTELRFICENYAGLTESEGYGNIADIIEKSRTKVFDFGFPIFDENYRSVLETKIIKHYYTREIGAETVGLWKHFLDRKMNEIMPYYNQLYKSELLEFNPLYDTDYKINSQRDITHDEDTSHDDTRTDDLQSQRTDNLDTLRTDNLESLRTDNLSELQTRNLHTKAVTDDDYTHGDSYSDTPQGILENVVQNHYLTNFRRIVDTDDTTVNTDETGTLKTDDTGTQTTNNTGTQDTKNTGTVTNNDTGTQNNKGTATRDYKNIDQYLESVVGKRGTQSYSKLLQEFRDTFLNIDMQIIRELAPLFMNIW